MRDDVPGPERDAPDGAPSDAAPNPDTRPHTRPDTRPDAREAPERIDAVGAPVDGPTEAPAVGHAVGHAVDPDGPPSTDLVPLPSAAPADPPAPPRLRAATWLLLGLLGLVAFGVGRFDPPRAEPEPTGPHAFLAMQEPPPVEEAIGQLGRVFEQARPATVRIEARCVAARLPRAFGAEPLGVGTGFFIDEDGTLLTAYHVVERQSLRPCPAPVSYVGVGPDGGEYPLDLLGFDAYLDLAVLEADVPDPVPFLPLAADAPRPGFDVVAIGNSRGDFLEDRAGRIRRIGVEAGNIDFADGTIELSAALAPGDSGGPVINRRGEAIGVVSYISFRPDVLQAESDPNLPPLLRGWASRGFDFGSYAVPVGLYEDTVERLRAGARRDIPVVGFTWAQIDYVPGRTAGLGRSLGPASGPVVGSVAPGGPADLAGLRPLEARTVRGADGAPDREVEADVITALDGAPTPTFEVLREALRAFEVGDVVTLRVQRGRETLELELELGGRRDVFEL